MDTTTEESVKRPPRLAVNLSFAALLLGLLMAQLDTNIVVAALPVISQDLHLGAAVAGITASTLLTVTVFTPVWGKLGDAFGRRFTLVVSVLVFGLASLMCAIAPTTMVLIAGRALQGVGAGGLIVTAVSGVAVIFDKEELVRRQIWMTAVFGISSLAGPPAGGFMASAWGWRSIFYVNLPICVLALLLGLWGLPKEPSRGTLKRFDYPGVLLLAIAGSALVSVGSSETLARNPVYAVPLVMITLLAVGLLVWRERRAPEPLIPPALFHIKTLRQTLVTTLLIGITLFGTFTFVPLALHAGAEVSTQAIGAMLLALTIGQLVIVTFFSVLVRRNRNLAMWTVLSLVMGVAGLVLLTVLPLLPHGTAVTVAIIGLALAGAALGLSLQVLTLIGQATAAPGQIGQVMGTITFTRQFGGAVGAAGFGWIMLLAPQGATAPAVTLGIAAVLLMMAFLSRPRDVPQLKNNGAGW
ncbi:MFS transporter [Nocardia sp. NPDC051570]|uniref:MFS transporter n=1 Tax=Nocardia sp. NPDC051570 TaxID=3364324 RepID=UPI0037884CD0